MFTTLARCARAHRGHGRSHQSLCCALVCLGLGIALPGLAGTPKNAPADAAADALRLHVPSPEWRDQIIYFVMIDRFEDGNPDNNDQGAGEYDPKDGARFSGGDLAGITQQLDYIRGLGATALWITPPVANKWWDEIKAYGGYHGYWAENFKAVDAHFGTLADYQRLSDRLHRAGMYLIQDIVVNHTANYFSYARAPDPAHPERGYRLNAPGAGNSAPTQDPFSHNDPRRAIDRKAAVYHWTPEIRDFADVHQVLDYQLAGLDDINTENPAVRATLRESYGHWIREVGVDGYRVDTAFYVPADYFEDFLYAKDAKFPGIDQVARKTGRERFHVFGEGFAMDSAFDETQARRIDSYMRGRDDQARMPGMLNFPLYGSTLEVFARGRPTAELGYRIASMLRVHAHPELMPSFVDNHDVDRFLAGAGVRALEQSLLLIMTLPGIPTIYYGTEQGFTEQRAAMFAAGFGADGRAHFDRSAPLYRFIAGVSALRREHRVFSRGTPQVVFESATGPGAFAYRMNTDLDAALVVFNTADAPVLLANLDTGLPPGTRLTGIFGLDAMPQTLELDAAGRVSLELPARAGLVWQAAGAVEAPVQTATLHIDPLPSTPVAGNLAVTGSAGKDQRVQLVLNGDLARAQAVTADVEGHWRATLDTRALLDARIEQQLVAWAADTGSVSATMSFRIAREWKLLAAVEDPIDDDRGPEGHYTYPTDPSYGRQLDITRARVLGAHGALRLELTMRELARAWNPPNGFDHVALSIFLEVPGLGAGAAALPFQNAQAPQGMQWQRRIRAHGWSNALFAATGAGAMSDGTTVTPAAQIEVDRDRKTLSFTLPAAALGNPETLSGLKVYVTTWDYDGGYKALAPASAAHSFGGGDGAHDPLIMDAVWIEVE